MKGVNAKRFIVAASGLCLALVINLSLGVKSHAATITCGSGASCPIFSVTGGDVFAGGWFSSTTDPTTCKANYQNGQTSRTTTNDGGILSYATDDGSGVGSSSQYGAFALGSIEGNDAAFYGFISGAAVGGSKNQLSFANDAMATSGNAWGGQFEGTNPQAHCIPDYYDTEQNTPTPLSSGNLSDPALDTLSNPQYSVDTGGGIFTMDGGEIAAGKNLTIFVKGSVYITGNIQYASHTADNVPKFALVVQGGDIYIDPAVTELDGWYIAQPAVPPNGTPTSDDGVIWTCHPAGNNPILQNTDLNACTNTLTVNGALTAKQVNLTRINNNGIGSGNQSAPAEILNYSPDMVIGGSFFNTSGGVTIDSIVSLPPVY